jgi:ABC-type antimicrobial peptide transport system permease subunit
VRTAGDPAALIPTVRRLVHELEPNLPLSDVKTQNEQIGEALFQERLFARLSAFFGVLALLLACVGLHGLMAYGVTRRTNEIGIRLALGGHSRQVLWMVLGESMWLVITGIAVGIPLTMAATRLVRGLLYGLGPADPTALLTATVIMMAVAALAGYLPARQASRLDPMVALRYE